MFTVYVFHQHTSSSSHVQHAPQPLRCCCCTGEVSNPDVTLDLRNFVASFGQTVFWQRSHRRTKATSTSFSGRPPLSVSLYYYVHTNVFDVQPERHTSNITPSILSVSHTSTVSIVGVRKERCTKIVHFPTAVLLEEPTPQNPKVFNTKLPSAWP